jgi:hypothetical protein
LDISFFFAEDIFGGQFGIGEDGIYSFDPETGAREKISPDLEGWADCIVTDYEYLTGQPIANKWQTVNGIIPLGFRLVPKIPFVCGGEYAVENLYSLEAVKGMKSRGNLARQIRDVPDGGKIEFKVIS